MSLLLAWVAFPLVLVVLSLGCGRLLERVSGVHLPLVLLLPAGLAAVIVLAQPATLSEATAELAVPAVLAAAAAGLVLWRSRPLGALDPWALACAVGVFCVFSAPFLASGATTLGGYIKLDDTASWLALADRAVTHGSSTAGLAPSTYEAVLDFYLGSDYPLGGLLPLAAGREVLAQDAAWLYQPYLSVLAAMLALSLYALLAGVVESRPVRAAFAFLAAQPAVLFGQALWGGFKEIAAAWLLCLIVALVPVALRAASPLRGVLPLAVASAAVLGVLSTGGAIWLLPVLLPALALLVQALRQAEALRRAGVFAAVFAALSVPAFLALDFLGAPAASTIVDQERLANLFQPLSWLQIFGVWPTGEFRLRPDPIGLTYVLVAIVAAAAVLGVVAAWRARQRYLLLYVGAAAVGCAVVVIAGSPWVGAKGLATASPAIVLTALAGAWAVARSGRGWQAGALVVVIGGGILWSNALAYQEVSLAPHERFQELREIGDRIGGQGPTLMTEYEPYGVRYFLRAADPEGASELRRRQVPLRDGSVLGRAETADIDEFAPEAVLTYRTLVLRRSPVASRPPSAYRLVDEGRYYEVWQRDEPPQPAIIRRLPLGGEQDPAATPDCPALLQLARMASGGQRLATSSRPPPLIAGLDDASLPSGWRPSGEPGAVLPEEEGTVGLDLSVEMAGSYELWIGGSFRGRLQVSIDGAEVFSGRHELSHGRPYASLGTVELDAGEHRAVIRYDGPDIHPGSGGRVPPLGPLALSPAGPADRGVELVEPAEARSLCDRRLDWVEVVE